MSLEERMLQELSFDSVLNHIQTYCVTEVGATIVGNLRPLSGISELQRELHQVDETMQIIITGETLPLEGFSNVTPLLQRSRITGNYLSAPELLSIYDALVQSRVLKRYLTDRSEKAPSLLPFAQQLVDDRIHEKHITDTIDESGGIRDNASRELLNIRSDIRAIEARLRSRLQHILKKYSEEELLQDDFITQRDGRFVLPLHVQNKRSVDGIIHGVSQSGQTVFFEPAETFELNNELSLLRGREQREIMRILTTLTAEVAAISIALNDAINVLAHIDSLQARAHYALEYGGCKPNITTDSLIELLNVKHPLLVHQSKRERQNPNTVVPLSVTIGNETRGILISGPNAGGKTVAMKTIGLNLCMAFSGIFPLGECTTTICNIFTSIGDHQSIDANLSTFSSQIITLRDILHHCDSHALVLIDEICAGTDPAEGGALAAGILDALIEHGAYFVVTTHQSSLKQYAITRSNITNASLAFDDVNMSPTFRFLVGVPGNSYAFDLAQSVGMPDAVLNRASDYLGGLHNEMEESIRFLQRHRKEAEQYSANAAADMEQARRLRIEYETKLHELNQKKSKLLSSAREQAAEIVDSAKALVENTIREIREQQKSVAESKREFHEKATEITRLTSQSDVSNQGHAEAQSLTVGDVVRIDGTNSEGTIITIDDRGYAIVNINDVKLRVACDKLQLVSAQRSSLKKAATDANSLHALRRTQSEDFVRSRTTPSMTLDIRGARADEALRLTEQFIDNAVVFGHPFVTIIHGKGTGALRKVVHTFLEHQNLISGYRSGTIAEGGDGVTIVEF